MSHYATFYINHADIQKMDKDIEKAYWAGSHYDDPCWKEFYDASQLKKPKLVFQKISLHIVEFETSKDIVKFRGLLKRFSIEFQETE